MSARTYLFTFASEGAAKVFLERLFRHLVDVATYREGTRVWVVDASEDDQRELLFRLAQTSGAHRARWVTG